MRYAQLKMIGIFWLATMILADSAFSLPRRKKKKYFDFSWNAEVGYEDLKNKDDKDADIDRLVAKLNTETTMRSANATLVSDFRLRAEETKQQPRSHYKLDSRAFYLRISRESWQANIGLQQVTWGEAFGIFVADIVNPYELGENLRTEPSEAKIPVGMLNVLTKWSNTSLELIGTPLPRRSSIPSQIGGIKTRKAEHYEIPKDTEYGVRFDYLFASGFDFKPFYLNHWNRFPVYVLRQTSEGPLLQQKEARVSTSGFSFSQAWNSWVLRGDFAYDHNLPVMQDNTEIKYAHHRQSVMGVDFTSASGKLTFGLQAQEEAWDIESSYAGKKQLYWGATRMIASLFKDKISPEIMFWRGINNHDAWLKVKVPMNLSANWQLSLSTDQVFSKEDGNHVYFSPTRNLFTKLTYSF